MSAAELAVLGKAASAAVVMLDRLKKRRVILIQRVTALEVLIDSALGIAAEERRIRPMAMRLRTVDGVRIALCAARSVEKPGDIYLDDGWHYAISEKYWRDYEEIAIECDPKVIEIVEREESNNPNREAWDAIYGAPVP